MGREFSWNIPFLLDGDRGALARSGFSPLLMCGCMTLQFVCIMLEVQEEGCECLLFYSCVCGSVTWLVFYLRAIFEGDLVEVQEEEAHLRRRPAWTVRRGSASRKEPQGLINSEERAGLTIELYFHGTCVVLRWVRSTLTFMICCMLDSFITLFCHRAFPLPWLLHWAGV